MTATPLPDPQATLTHLPAEPREIAWDRLESEPCEAGTYGCCIRHSGTFAVASDCEAW